MHQWFSQLLQLLEYLFQSSGIGDAIKNYPAPFDALFAVIIFPSLIYVINSARTAWRRHWDLCSLRLQVGSGMYTRDDILGATKFFIEPDCQSVDPSNGDDLRRAYSTREPSFTALRSLFQSEGNEKYTLILGDSGMGKTTLLLNYYARHYRKARPPFGLAIVHLGRNEADRTIESLRDRSNTILLLDAFDEDMLAIENHRNRLHSLLEMTKDFRHVLIACRTQFFEKADEEPQETDTLRIGPLKPGQARNYTFNKLYLSPFSRKQIKSYLKLRFSIWKFMYRRRALSISLRFSDLSARPMLLAYIPDLVDSGTQFNYSVQIYDSMIEIWLKRENRFVDPDKVRTFSGDLAVDIYTNRKTRGWERIPPDEAIELARQHGIELKKLQLRNRSLLNRDVNGNLKFSHRTIMEYLFTLKFMQDPNLVSNQIWTDQMKRFWWERITCIYYGLDLKDHSPDPHRTVQDLINQALSLGDLRGLETLSLQPLTPLPKIESIYADLPALEEYCLHFADLDQRSGKWTKRVPGLFQRITVSDPVHGGDSAHVVVDSVTGLMWYSVCNPTSYEDAIETARNIARQSIAGLNGWRIPSLREAFSLLPNSLSSSSEGSATCPFELFAPGENMIWTTDRIRFPSHDIGIACIFNDRKLAMPQSFACLRFVRSV